MGLALRIEKVTIVPPLGGWFNFYGMPQRSDIVRAIINTEPLLKIGDHFNLLIVVRIDDATIDLLADRKIKKSRQFSIAAPAITIDTTMSRSFVERLFPAPKPGKSTAATVTQYLLLIPKAARPEGILTLNDVRSLHGYILGSASMTVSTESELVPRRNQRLMRQ